MVLVGRADDEYSVVEVHIFNEATQDEYCHHEVMLTAHPLCIELVRLDELSLIAVGTMEPEIELWDLDLVDSVEPCVVLGAKKEKSKNGCGPIAGNHWLNYVTPSLLGLRRYPIGPLIARTPNWLGANGSHHTTWENPKRKTH